MISAVRDLNRLERTGESVRATPETLAVAAPLFAVRATSTTEA